MKQRVILTLAGEALLRENWLNDGDFETEEELQKWFAELNKDMYILLNEEEGQSRGMFKVYLEEDVADAYFYLEEKQFKFYQETNKAELAVLIKCLDL